jgi:long-chain-fatty-acid--CoA ligase ACSBG
MARLARHASLLLLAAGPPGSLAARVQVGSYDEALSADSDERLEFDLTPMSGPFTTNKLEYDTLTRYSEGRNITDAQLLILWLQRAARKNPDEIALRAPRQDKNGNLLTKSGFNKFNPTAHTHQYDKYTWKQYYDRVIDAAAAFQSMGLQTMDAVNIKGVNSPEWLITFLGCIAAGGLPVGLYPTDSPDTVKFKAQDSGATFIAVGKAKDLKTYSDFLDEESFRSVKAVIYWDVNPLHPESLERGVIDKLRGNNRKLVMWKDFLKTGASLPTASRTRVLETVVATRPGQAATVVYTSGTTGNPKGVLLSQDALTWSATQVAKELLTKDVDHMRIVSYLPLNHIAGQMLDIVAPLYISSRLSGEYCTTFFPAICFLKKTCFKEQLKDASPTLFLGVPEVWDGLKLKIEDATKSWLFGKINDIAPSILLKGVGLGSVQYAFSGAGPITKSTLKFFNEMGLDILSLFGQSESSAMGTGWRNEDFSKYNLDEKFGSIGRPLANKVRLVDKDSEGQGEIQLWGRNIMLGYMNRPDKTADALTEDGWLKTGDLGRQDSDGFVWLTGRLKEIMKDKGGEMIAPVAVEEGIKLACNKPGASIVKQVIVVGDGKYYISALLTLVEAAEEGIPTGKLTGSAKNVDSGAKTVAEAIQSDKWAATLSQCIAEYNSVAAKSQERVFRYLILPKDITREDSPDLMTQTFKIKRTEVSKKYAAEIESCGGDEALTSREVKTCGSA